MSETQSISAELDASAAIAARDQMIITLQGQIRELMVTADHAGSLQAALDAANAEVAGLKDKLSRCPPPIDPKPPMVKMTAPHGFIDEAGVQHYWGQGQIVTSAADIALLKSRGAPIVDA